jgi:hypothetical protein
MGYLKIPNLYQKTSILQFKQLYALEKIDGSSANVSYKDGTLTFFSGGANHQMFMNLFNHEELCDKFKSLGHMNIRVHGEAYGGKLQGMRHTYGDNLKFVVFDVKIKDAWIDVPKAESVCKKLGLEFVHYELIDATVEEANRVRDQESIQAIRNGCGGGKVREGVVLRPLQETEINGARVIVKHKAASFRETRTTREVDPEKLVILTQCQEIADEWVTEMRLRHVLDKLPECKNPSDTPQVIEAMLQDVVAESTGEIILSKEAVVAIKRASAKLFISRLKKGLGE